MKRVPPVLLMVGLAASLMACGPGASPTPTQGFETPAAEPTPRLPIEPPSEQIAEQPAPTVEPPTRTEPVSTPTELPSLEISSSAFEPGGAIPVRHSCFGDNTSPPLSWSGVPEATQSLVLLVDDPDSRPPGFVHWVIFNIPPTAAGLAGDLPTGYGLSDGSLQGSNGFAPYGPGTFPGGAEIKLVGYDGPCPPGGEHRYVFTLYALDKRLGLAAEATMAEVQAAMEGHILAQAELIGLFAPP